MRIRERIRNLDRVKTAIRLSYYSAGVGVGAMVYGVCVSNIVGVILGGVLVIGFILVRTKYREVFE